MIAKAKEALPSSRSLIQTPALIKKTWGNLNKLWRKKLFCAKTMTTLHDLTVLNKKFEFYLNQLPAGRNRTIKLNVFVCVTWSPVVLNPYPCRTRSWQCPATLCSTPARWPATCPDTTAFNSVLGRDFELYSLPFLPPEVVPFLYRTFTYRVPTCYMSQSVEDPLQRCCRHVSQRCGPPSSRLPAHWYCSDGFLPVRCW